MAGSEIRRYGVSDCHVQTQTAGFMLQMVRGTTQDALACLGVSW